MQSRSVDLDGPVHFADFGGSGPTMVLVHGLGGSHVNWAAVGPALATRARVLAPDLAGFGRTPLAGRIATVQANRRLLDRFLDAMSDGPAILVGNSMGGLIALLEAARRPGKIAALVLVGPAQPRPSRTLVDPIVGLTFAAYALPGIGEGVLRWGAAGLGPERLVPRTLSLCCSDVTRVAPEMIAAHVALARERQAMPWAHTAFLQAARSIIGLLARRRHLAKVIASVRAPTLVVQGTEDRLVPLAASRATVARRPDWSLAVFDGVGHVPQLEAPERFVETVTAWMAAPRVATAGAVGASSA